MKKFEFLPLVAIALIAFWAGCDSGKTDSKNGAGGASTGETAQQGHGGDHSQEGHAHGEGPHGGTIVDWGGGKFHVEFTVDHDKQQATAYVLGSDEKTETPIDADEITLAIKDPAFSTALKPEPLAGDPEGSASRFVGHHKSLGIVQEYEGSMSAVVGGIPYSGTFKELAH